jgi:hypothetical protein
MLRLFGPGLLGLIVMALWIYCILDVIATEDSLVRSLPKGVWLLLVIVLPMIGAVAWLGLGRPLYAGWRPGDTTVRPTRPVVGPEDRIDFPKREALSPPPDESTRLQAWEADLRRREEELRRQSGEDESP